MAVQFAGQGLGDFGCPTTSGLSIVTSSTVSSKVDKKEIKGSKGDTQVVAYYNLRNECSAEGYGSISATAVGSNSTSSIAGVGCHIEEVSDTYSNEDFSKASIKGTAYSFDL